MKGATTIHKCTRDREYTKVSNLLMQNDMLSYKARGLMCYILSLPKDWEILVEHLHKQSRHEGKHAVRSAMKELAELGYLYLEVIKDARTGQIKGKRWLAFDEPGDNPHYHSAESQVFRPSGFPTVGQSATTKETEETKERYEQKKQIIDIGCSVGISISSPSDTEALPERKPKPTKAKVKLAGSSFTDEELLSLAVAPSSPVAAQLRWHQLHGTSLD